MSRTTPNTVIEAIKTFKRPPDCLSIPETLLNVLLTEHLQAQGLEATCNSQMRSGRRPDIRVAQEVLIEAKKDLLTLNTYAQDALLAKVQRYKRNRQPKYDVVIVCYGDAKRRIVEKLKQAGAVVLVAGDMK